MKKKTNAETQVDGDSYCVSLDRCTSCSTGIWAKDSFTFGCNHTYCYNCANRLLFSQVTNHVDQIRCPLCLKPLSPEEVNTIDPNLSAMLECEQLDIVQRNVKECFSCHLAFIYEPGKTAGITIDLNGRPMRPEALECLRLNRCTCPRCDTSFCMSCREKPFHDGYTCNENMLIKKGIVCRFCGEPFVKNGEKTPLVKRVCSAKECQKYFSDSCKYVHPCGHPCVGLNHESKHMPCQTCDSQGGQLCVYCAEELTKSPSILLKCGHPCHLSCVLAHFETCVDVGKIKLPKCGHFTCREVPQHPSIEKNYKKWIPIHDEIEKMIRDQMVVEGLAKDPRVLNPDDQDFYNDPLGLAHSIFLFFTCEMCKKPFYGGHAECGANDDEENNLNNNNDNENNNNNNNDNNNNNNNNIINIDYYDNGHNFLLNNIIDIFFGDNANVNVNNYVNVNNNANVIVNNPVKKKYLCNKCSRSFLKSCPKHGDEGMKYKCFYCCNEAEWFCFGTTHFCTPCHNRYAEAMKGPWKKCNGKCQFAPHQENGIAQISGYCALCESVRKAEEGTPKK